ncbi:hypothetical protein B0H66DRAFT_594453 [Apodospora peruviana]|uniref:Peptidase C14 caspase domain-containing protein n=1 Tax=Apodospora peruviana TaxID=516989 RepID=A0AAE0HX29_9PEZI|nr:hypothetical protein B0H66DRAFT_594453 [Apodospora peruviana]
MSRYERHPQDGIGTSGSSSGSGQTRRYQDYDHPRWDNNAPIYRDHGPRRSPTTAGGGGGYHYDGGRPRARDSDRDRRDKDRFRMTDRERENLKQRLSVPPAQQQQQQQRNHLGRTRSLSLSRSGSSSRDSSPEITDRRRYHNSEHQHHHQNDKWDSHRRPRRDEDRFYLTPPVRQHPQRPPSVPAVRYYHDERLSSLSSPEMTPMPLVSLSRKPGSRSPPALARDEIGGGGDDLVTRFDRGFRLVERPSRLHHSDDDVERMLPLSEADSMRDLRFGLQRMSTDLGGPPGPRIVRRLPSRSASIDGRNAVTVKRRLGPRSMTPPYSRPLKPQYTQVHVLILTWIFHDLKQAPYTAPPASEYTSLEDETRRVRDTFESFGYKVREFLIPMRSSTEYLRSKLKQFTRLAADDTLLIVYYHGHGCLDDDNELVFSSHEHPSDPVWSQNAAAEMYAALMSGDSCPAHGRHAQYQNLVKKYERYRPVAEVKWEEIRPTVLGAPCDLLLILDCCAAGGANLGHVNWRPPPQAEGYTKHLFAACGFESFTSDDMTAAMCEVLDEWAPDLHTSPRPSPFLTTKRLHQIMEEKLQKDSVGSQPIFKQLLPHDPEQYITLPNLLDRNLDGRGRRGYFLG